MFVVTAILTVQPDRLEEFLERLRIHVVLTLKEGRCRNFNISESTENPCRLFYHEEFDRKELFEEHANSARVKKHIESTSAMLDGDVWFAKWNRVSNGW